VVRVSADGDRPFHSIVLTRFGHRDHPYRRAPRLFDELKLARADGTYPRLLAKLARVDVLIIDDFAVAPVTDAQRGDLLEILEDRYGARSTIVTSQLEPKLWHDYLADPTLADAICDRLLNNAHRIVLKPVPEERRTQESTLTTHASLRSDHDAPEPAITMARSWRSRCAESAVRVLRVFSWPQAGRCMFAGCSTSNSAPSLAGHPLSRWLPSSSSRVIWRREATAPAPP
jgi:hypothetical protein